MLGSQQPTIVFTVVDDCRRADPRCTGQTGYGTQACDQLAAQGMRFTRAYADTLFCINASVAALTGDACRRWRHVGNRGQDDWNDQRRNDRALLSDQRNDVHARDDNAAGDAHYLAE